MSKYQVIVMESPYENYEKSLEVRDLLKDVFKLKLDGYKAYHEFGIMPVGSDDFFSNHIIICQEKEDGELRPVAAFKSITNGVSNRFNISFPIIEHNLKGVEEDYQDHVTEVVSWLNDKQIKNEIVGYNFGWTISPFIKERSERDFLINFSTAMYFYYYNNYNINHVITAAFKDFGVHKIQERMGFSYFEKDGEALPAFRGKVFQDKEAYFMYLEDLDFPVDFKSSVKFFEKYWNNRITYNNEKLSAQDNEAA